jgi:dihydroneopterin aldolase
VKIIHGNFFMDYIILENIRIHAKHGCLQEENILGATYEITVKIGLDLDTASRTGDINDTVNYAGIYKLIREEMQIPSKILEQVAGRMANRILEASELIRELELRLSKLNPPLPGQVGRSTIVLKRVK